MERPSLIDRAIEGVIAHRKAVVAAFVALAVACAALIPFVGVNYNMVDYLPDEAQSTTAVDIMGEEFSQAVPNANVLVRDVSVAQALAFKDRVAAIDGVEGVMWLDDVADVTVPLQMIDEATVETYYRDGTALFQVTVAEGAEGQAVGALRALVDEAGPNNAVSGDASDTAQTTASTGEEAGRPRSSWCPSFCFCSSCPRGRGSSRCCSSAPSGCPSSSTWARTSCSARCRSSRFP